MKKHRESKGRLGALVGLFSAMLVGLFITVVAAPAGVPTLRFYCMDFNLMPDGSVQALVKVQAEHLEMFRGTDFNLKYNADYLVPSVYTNNNPYADNATPITRDFFETDSGLYAGNEPFVTGSDARYGSVDRTKSTLTLDLALDQTALITAGDPGSKIGEIQLSQKVKGDVYVAYVDTATTEVTLGELSFWVPAEKITEMVEKYSAATPVDPPLLAATKPTGGPTANAWELLYYLLTSGTYKTETFNQDSGAAVAKVEYIFEFPDTLVKADLPVDYVRLNAWEAYADGGWTDIAAALQRYAGQITVGYANGNLENLVFPWGKANTANPLEPQSDYTVYALNNGVTWTDEASLKALDESDWTQMTTGTDTYNPKEGVYKVQQHFLYEEEGVNKRYPVARTAYLVIDPVELTGAWAKDWDKTYRASNAPTSFDDLRLPVEGILQTAPTLGRASLTVPIRGWNPNTLPSNITNRVVGTYQFAPTYVQADLNAAAQTKYPWLTLGNATLGSATRTIVADGDAMDPTVGSYTLTAAHGTADHSLELEVRKSAADGTAMDISAVSTVELYLPNGVKVEPTWWSAGGYTVTRVDTDADSKFHYLLELDADLASTATQDQKDQLVRYVNLGGWLSVTVDEPAVAPNPDPAVSDKIYGHLAPRPNLYTKSYIGAANLTTGTLGAFDFTGYYAGLLPLYATSVDANKNAMVEALSSTVTLPLGYGISTTYDGTSGAEPGNLRVARVNSWSVSGEIDGVAASPEVGTRRWKVAPGKTLKLDHGPDNFLDGALYDGYGRVNNPSPEKQVQILAEYYNPDMGTSGGGTPPQKPVEALAVYENGVVTTGVVYDTKQRGYVAREERMLTLKNIGTTDVSGIWLDMDHAPFDPDTKGHFELLRAPAAYLPAGGETTFIVTYVYNLDYYVGANVAASGTTYKDIIAVNTAQTTAATSFTAQFRVTQGPVSTVEVVTIPTPDPAKPGGNLMGTAMVIQGLGEGLPNPATDLSAKPDSTPGNTSYEEGYKSVWIQANPVSEYTVKEVYYYVGNNSAGVKVPLIGYLYAGTDGAGEYYYFPMPGHRVTVYVEFEESIESKLRMSSLRVYGGIAADVNGTPGDAGSTLIDPATQEAGLQVLRRDDKDTNALLTYPSNTTGASDANPKLSLTEEQSSYPAFFSVLPAETDYAQLALTLRQTMEMLGLDNSTSINHPLANVEVLITTPDPDGDVFILNSSKAADMGGSTGNPPTDYLTYAFAAPAKGEEMVITITLAYEDTTVNPSVRHERAFTVRLVRLSGEGITPPLGYGNSPFGMIMNDALTDKDLAKAAFQVGNTFTGLDPAHVPAKAAGLTNVYWSQAPGYADGVMVSTWPNTNYDLDETALFVMANQAFLDPGIRGGIKDSAGNPVVPTKVVLSIPDVDLLTAGQVTQQVRFASTGKQTFLLNETLDEASGAGVAAGWAGTDAIRPGVYALTYSFTDYDGTQVSFRRPLIILTAVGDANADGQVTALGDATIVPAGERDEALMENRVTDPLGYAANTTWSWGELFRLRVCDGNNDRFIDHIDSNAIKAKALTPYYLPVDYK